jgi:adenylate cyclase
VDVGQVRGEVLVGDALYRFVVVLPVFMFLSFVVVAFERTGHYVEAAAVTVVATLVMCCLFLPPGHRRLRLVEQWAAGKEVVMARIWVLPAF